MKADTGATGNYIRNEDALILNHVVDSTTGPHVRLPDNSIIKPTKSGHLPIPVLPQSATEAHVFPSLKSASLLSIGQLCDSNCSALFTKKDLTIFDSTNAPVLKGQRNETDGLWDVNLPSQQPLEPASSPTQPKYSAHAVLNLNQTKSELARYLHAAAGCPTKSTFIQAINNGNFVTWPGLTSNLISKHLPPSIPTIKGHIKQEQQNLRSTKPSVPVVKIEPETPPDQEDKTGECYVTIATKESGTTYSDLTGRYPITSSRGNQYIVICYDYDTNSIQAKPTKTRNAAEIRDATIAMLTQLSISGHAPKLHILDNEASSILKKSLLKHKIQYQLVPPHIHRRNAAERAIQTFKAHFITCLCTADPEYPAKEWDRFLPQSVITLNLLRNCRFNPKLSAHTALHRVFDYNKTPLAPLGTKVVIHEKTDKRKTWSTHGTDGWYIGPALEHYRCVDCYVPATHSTRIADTVAFIPTVVPIPSTSTEDYLRQSVGDIIALLNDPKPTIPALSFGNDTQNAIKQIATLLNRALPSPPPVLPSPPAIPPTVPRTPKESTQTPMVSIPPSPVPPAPAPRVSEYAALDPRVLNSPTPAPRVPAKVTPAIPTKPKATRLPRPVQPRLQRSTYVHPSRRHTRSTALAQLLRSEYDQHISHMHHPEHHVNHMYHPTTGKRETYESLRAQDPERWGTSFANEIGRLAQGVGERMKTGNENIFFIKKHQVPNDRKVTYANPVCDYRPLKEDKYRVRLTVGGDRLPYPEDSGSPAATLLEAKILFNSVISTPGSRFIVADIKDYFLQSPMDRFEYIKIPFKWIPEEIRQQYNLYDIVEPDGYVYCEVRKGMYGLKQAARLAFDNLVKNLAPHGYHPVRESPGLWKHETRPTVFTLCVDDFGIKANTKDDALHLLNAIKTSYKISIDWEGKDYLGLSLVWNYAKKYVDISMPWYIPSALHKFQHKKPTRPQDAPHAWTQPVYGQRIQYAKDPSNSPLLNAIDTLRVQSINGTILYYARAIDPTLLPALNEISTSQAAPTQDTMDKCNQVLDYVATHPLAVIRYRASDMILMTDTDAAYLVLPKARSRIAGHYYFTNRMDDYTQGIPMANGPVLTECKTLRSVVSSSAEAETGGTFANAQHVIPMKHILETVFRHPQPAKGSPIVTDNLTSQGILTKLIKPRKSKTWDMRYHWLEDRISQKDIQLIWKRGKYNWADYFTKHHPPAYHRLMRPKYLLHCVTACLTKAKPLLARVC